MACCVCIQVKLNLYNSVIIYAFPDIYSLRQLFHNKQKKKYCNVPKQIAFL